MNPDLQSFIGLLRRENELAEIAAEVDPRLEAAEIHRRVIARGGPALLFRSIRNADYPLVTNLFGTERRVELAFGPQPEKLVSELLKLPEQLFPLSASGLWRNRRRIARALSIGTRQVTASLPVREKPRLSRLPLLTSWQQDGGAFITLPLVFTRDPARGVSNLGIYRMQRYDDTAAGFHCQIGKGAGFHLAQAASRREKLPVNVFIGGPPAVTLAAVAPLPENVPELLLAALLLRKKVRLSANPCGRLPLLADAEFVLTGTVDPGERRPEGPFGDHYGYYSLQHEYPVFRCAAVFRRSNPVFTATVVGKPRQEDYFLGNYLQELLAPLFPYVMPGVRRLWSYGETGYHPLAAAQVEQRYRREAMVSAFRILGEGQLALTKFLLAVDSPVDLKNFSAVLEHVLERADFNSDLYIFSNLAMDTLDYTGPAVNEGSKGVLLGLGDARRSLPGDIPGDLPSGLKAAVFCRGCLVLSGPAFSAERALAQRLLAHPAFTKWPLLVLVDDAERTCRSSSDFLWTVFTRFEPAADISARSTRVIRNHPAFEPPIAIDARMKPSYPDELECDAETSELVTRRWGEYFGGKCPSAELSLSKIS